MADFTQSAAKIVKTIAIVNFLKTFRESLFGYYLILQVFMQISCNKMDSADPRSVDQKAPASEAGAVCFENESVS